MAGEQRLLDSRLTMVLSGPVPDAGYAVSGHQLFRNGEHVGEVRQLQWDRDVGAWWIHYVALPGSALDALDQQSRRREQPAPFQTEGISNGFGWSR